MRVTDRLSDIDLIREIAERAGIPGYENDETCELIWQVLNEWGRARKKFPPFNSAHEGYAVLLEEVRELEAEVFKGGTEPRSAQAMYDEAIQVAAMGLRFADEPGRGTR